MEYYVYIKSLHVIFVVAWFAALFYMPRLLIYHTEAALKTEAEKTILGDQFKIMQRRLWNGIAWPSLILTWLFGLWMLILNPDLLLQAWFVLKLVFVSALTLYHIQTHVMYRRQQNDIFRWTSFQLRLWNEVATIFLFIIIFLVIPKQNTGWVWGTLSVLVLAGAVFGATAIYRANRSKNEDVPPPSPPPASPPPMPPSA
jgi:protoporphyrinogen IX oxidase